MSGKIYYHDGLKYQLTQDLVTKTRITGFSVRYQYTSLDTDGTLTIRAGFCWDGASGGAFDTKSIIRGSCVHDALYQLIRQGLLPDSAWIRSAVDKTMRTICIEDGMWKIRAHWIIFKALERFGKKATTWKARRKVKEAP